MSKELLLDVVVLGTVGPQPVLYGVHHLYIQLLQLKILLCQFLGQEFSVEEKVNLFLTPQYHI